MNDDIRHRLEEAGRQPAPAPDRGYADALEARLRALAVTASAPSEPPRRPVMARPRLTIGGGLMAGAVVLAILLAVTVGPGRTLAAPELSAPVNVEVALRDGTVLEDPDGLRLPDGAVVRVGAGGSARIGETVLVPGDVATVEQARLRVEHDQPVGQVPAATPPGGGTAEQTPSDRPTHSPSRTPPAPTRSPAPTVHPSPTPRQTAAPTLAPRPVPPTSVPTLAPPSVPPRPVPTATPEPARTDPPSTPSPTPTITRPGLHARFVAPSGIRVTWTAMPGAASYVLMATGSNVSPAPRPRYPGGRVIGEFTSVPGAPLRFSVPDGTVEVRLLVVALAPDGTEIARSRIITVKTGG